jgi:hypothetical protein
VEIVPNDYMSRFITDRTLSFSYAKHIIEETLANLHAACEHSRLLQWREAELHPKAREGAHDPGNPPQRSAFASTPPLSGEEREEMLAYRAALKPLAQLWNLRQALEAEYGRHWEEGVDPKNGSSIHGITRNHTETKLLHPASRSPVWWRPCDAQPVLFRVIPCISVVQLILVIVILLVIASALAAALPGFAALGIPWFQLLFLA